ncbi:MAG: molybdenum cofactor guanylyltransferase [Bacteroidales bacterium]|nr:molybdenum cofactor guanylyltransferase [Bacteroidales bacterium]
MDMERLSRKYDYTAAILAGGQNLRFSGKIKAKMIINGRPLIEKTMETLQAIFNDVIIITNQKDAFSKYKHIRMTGDIYQGIGPLGGLHSALSNTEGEAVFVVASDMPDLSADIIRYIIEKFEDTDCEVLIPEYNGNIEPLHAIYKRNILNRLESFIETGSGYSIREFLEIVNDKYVMIDDAGKVKNPFRNINRPEDLPGGESMRDMG